MSVEPRMCERKTHRRVATTATLLVLATGLGLGCASVNPMPFAEFVESTEQLREGADAALSHSMQSVRERAARQIVEASETQDGFRELRDRYSLETDPPGSLDLDHRNLALVFQLPVFRRGVYGLNTVLVDYATLLHQLALPELIPKERIEQMARDLNANLADAAKVIRPDAPVDGQRIALFVTGAAVATEVWLEWTRRRHLKQVIERDRPAMAEVSRLGREAIDIMAELLQQEYSEGKQDVFRTLAPREGGPSPGAKRQAAQALIELDEAYLTQLASLRTLAEAYGALPEAHAELLAAVGRPELTLASIKQLYDAGKRLERLHSELVKAHQ